jgi:hypothetical protein
LIENWGVGGGPDRIRTGDLLHVKPLEYQLKRHFPSSGSF